MVYAPEQYMADFITAQYCLAEIPDFQGLLPKAHQAGVPVFELTDREIGESGTVLEGMQEKRALFAKQFENLAQKITALMQYA
ncbi:MAG TPA: hypothetical protein VF472_21375 [Burkholderiaceae bacterium]